MDKQEYTNLKNILYAKYYNELYEIKHMKANHYKNHIKKAKQIFKQELKALKLEYKNKK